MRKIRSANIFIHLTDFCNENCSFCFAREEMSYATKKQIGFDDFKKITLKLKKMGVLKLDFLGGEPTLHPQLEKILEYSLKHFFSVRIYTNGIFSEKVRNVILNNASRVSLTLNISTPGFQLNKKIRELVLNNIDVLTPKTSIALSVVSLFMNDSIIEHFKHIPRRILKKIKVKLSFMTPMAHDKNLLSINDFPKVGKNLCNVIKKIEKMGPPLQFRFNKTMFRPCMFTQEDKVFLKKINLDFVVKNTTCHKDEKIGDLFHITSDLSTFKCYPLSTIDIFKVKNNNLENLQKKYLQLQREYRSNLILPTCKKCPFFGLDDGKCSGPCLGFRINALKNSHKIVNLSDVKAEKALPRSLSHPSG